MASLDHLRLLVRIAARRSVSRAARDLAIPQPTASRWVAQLEQHYGQPLLHRSSRAVTLTHAGETCLAYAQDVLDKEVALHETLTGTQHGHLGKLTIGAPSAFGTWVVLPDIAAFKKQNARLGIDLRLSDQYTNVTAEGVDLALRIGQLEDSQLVASRIGNLREVAVCHPSLPRGIDCEDPEHVQQLPWIRFSGLRNSARIELRRHGKTKLLTIKPEFWVDNIVALREAMLLGIGASLIHHYAVASDIAEGRLVELVPQWQLPNWPVSIVTPAGRRNPRAAAFAQHIKTYMKNTLAERR